MSRSDLLMLHWHEITATELDVLIVTLELARLIATSATTGGKIIYTMTPKCLEIFKKETK